VTEYALTLVVRYARKLLSLSRGLDSRSGLCATARASFRAGESIAAMPRIAGISCGHAVLVLPATTSHPRKSGERRNVRRHKLKHEEVLAPGSSDSAKTFGNKSKLPLRRRRSVKFGYFVAAINGACAPSGKAVGKCRTGRLRALRSHAAHKERGFHGWMPPSRQAFHRDRTA
jgi:hypothetical protein